MAAKSIGVTEQTYYRWRKEYGGLQVNQAKRLKDMEKENARLRDECLNEEVFQTLAVARSTLGRWRYDYNNVRLHSTPNNQPSAASQRSLELRQGSAHAVMATRSNNQYQTERLSKEVWDPMGAHHTHS